MWTYVRDDRPAGDSAAPAVWFAYSPDRKGEHPERHLRKFRGTLQADAYAGFNQLYADGRIEQAACWAHVRRHFYDLEQAHASPIARETLQRIGTLYTVEEPIRGKPPDERRKVRQAQAFSFFAFPRHLWRKLRTTNVIERCFVEVRPRTRPMVCFVNVESVDRIIYSIFQRFNLEWNTRTLNLFTQAA